MTQLVLLQSLPDEFEVIVQGKLHQVPAKPGRILTKYINRGKLSPEK